MQNYRLCDPGHCVGHRKYVIYPKSLNQKTKQIKYENDKLRIEFVCSIFPECRYIKLRREQQQLNLFTKKDHVIYDSNTQREVVPR